MEYKAENYYKKLRQCHSIDVIMFHRNQHSKISEIDIVLIIQVNLLPYTLKCIYLLDNISTLAKH